MALKFYQNSKEISPVERLPIEAKKLAEVLYLQISVIWTTFLHMMDSLLIRYDMMIFFADFNSISGFFLDFSGFSFTYDIINFLLRKNEYQLDLGCYLKALLS